MSLTSIRLHDSASIVEYLEVLLNYYECYGTSLTSEEIILHVNIIKARAFLKKGSPRIKGTRDRQHNLTTTSQPNMELPTLTKDIFAIPVGLVVDRYRKFKNHMSMESSFGE
ncbi:hypothetical protein Tco_0347258 [Tanacetum coccineum]